MYRNNRRGPRGPSARYSWGQSNSGRRKAKKAQEIDPAKFVSRASADYMPEYQAMHDFNDFAIHPLLKSNINKMGYKKPSEIQDKTIALSLMGKSVVGVADTGTGKTAAFSLPILNRLMRQPASQALVIAPTRELAIQIEEQCRTLAKNSGLYSALLIGGSPMGRQLTDLKHKPRIIIGTPGRIKDHLNQNSLNLSWCDMIVLDEVDRMLDMGFINDVRFILAKLPAEHQAFFFSATLSPDIRNLIDTFVQDPEVINVKTGETSQNVNQDIVRYNGKTEKLDQLHNILISPGVDKTIIFGRTKHGVDRLGKELIARGFKASSIHGGKSQGQRNRALEGFRFNQINVLVATDVAARGIDVSDITHVINFDAPQTYNDYIHRIGRAGRMDNPGNAITMVEDTSR